MENRRDVFQAIADPTRRSILSLLIQRPHNLNALAERFDMSRQAVSLHVKVLTECGIVSIKQDGRERICRVELQKIAEVHEWLEPFRLLWDNRFNQLDSLLKIMNADENDIPE